MKDLNSTTPSQDSLSLNPSHGPLYPAIGPPRVVVKRIDLQTLGRDSVEQLITSLLKDADIQVPLTLS